MAVGSSLTIDILPPSKHSTKRIIMKYLLFMTTLMLVFSSFQSCKTDDDDADTVGNWIRRSDFEGNTRSNAVSFAIGGLAYVGLGQNSDDDLSDFWQYDPTADFWTKVDSFPGTPRRAAVAFTLNGKGYVGTGYNIEKDEELNDFWEFDPAAPEGNQWRQVADFIGTARYNAVAFAVNGKGYVGTGYDGNWLKDFFEYDPETDTWEQIVSLGGSKREDAVAFVVGDRAFVGTGRNNGAYVYDFWEFDAVNKSWESRLDLDEDDDYSIARHGAVGFSLDGYGYIVTGSNGSSQTSAWEYDTTTDTWTERTGIEGIARLDAVGFTVAGRSFVATGNGNGTRLDDIWEFRPKDEYDEDD